MKLTYGFLCNYAAPGAAGKPTAVGIFDGLFVADGEPIILHPCLIHGHVAATGELATKHVFTFELHDADANVLWTLEVPAEMAPGRDGVGRGLYLYINFGGFELPGYGNYEIVLKAGGIRFADISLFVGKVVNGEVVQA